MARLLPRLADKPKIHPPGSMGEIWIANDLDVPLPDDLIAAYEAGV